MIFGGIWNLGGDCLAGARTGVCLEKGSRGVIGATTGCYGLYRCGRGWCGWTDLGHTTYGEGPRGSGRAAFLKTYAADSRGRGHILGDGVLEAVENFVGGVLEASVGLVQLSRRLGGELTELVAVGDVSEGSKNEI